MMIRWAWMLMRRAMKLSPKASVSGNGGGHSPFFYEKVQVMTYETEPGLLLGNAVCSLVLMFAGQCSGCSGITDSPSCTKG